MPHSATSAYAQRSPAATETTIGWVAWRGLGGRGGRRGRWRRLAAAGAVQERGHPEGQREHDPGDQPPAGRAAGRPDRC